MDSYEWDPYGSGACIFFYAYPKQADSHSLCGRSWHQEAICNVVHYQCLNEQNAALIYQLLPLKTSFILNIFQSTMPIAASLSTRSSIAMRFSSIIMCTRFWLIRHTVSLFLSDPSCSFFTITLSEAITLYRLKLPAFVTQLISLMQSPGLLVARLVTCCPQ